MFKCYLLCVSEVCMLLLAANCTGVCVSCLPSLVGGLYRFGKLFIYLFGWAAKTSKLESAQIKNLFLPDNWDEIVPFNVDKLFSFPNHSLKSNPGFSK